jgi:L-seryl-tRNA(Ser) seleniumtransferase
MGDNPYRNLPSVHEVLQSARMHKLRASYSQESIVEAVRHTLACLRERVTSHEVVDGELRIEAVAQGAATRLEKTLRLRLQPVINATGIVIHTNLGRAPLAEEAARAAYEAGRGYSNLEMDLESGKRSSRQLIVRDWICRLTGAESATVVNNNAAGTVIVLRSLCKDKEVIISRGQLIEIGGSFRIPEIMAVSGARLREVGTTNITRLSDYERAASPETGALLRVHTSNYRITGFTESVSLSEMVALGKKHGLPVIDDIGSGALFDFEQIGLAGEPVAADSILAGADLVLFSGDKLLGGPQAGIIAGRKQYIDKIEADPLMRAFRPDKMTLAALEATLRLYLGMAGDAAANPCQCVPVLRMISDNAEQLKQRAEGLAEKLRALPVLSEVEVRSDQSYAGGGSLPEQALPTWVVAVKATSLSDVEFARCLRAGSPPIIARVQGGSVLFDLRTMVAEQEAVLAEAIRVASQNAG